MKNLHLLLFCVLGAVLLSSVLCSNPVGSNYCCFQHYPRRMRKNLFNSYYHTDPGCPLPGVILVAQNGSPVCVGPELDWVQAVMRELDEKTF